MGRDARGRKQYRYHSRWREIRDETKYARMIDFGRALPRIRRRVQDDVSRAGLPREKVLAAVVGLLETTLIRVGNEEYARQNGSYGLTTLRAKHVRVDGGRVRFEFRGKGGKPHVVALTDRRLARVVRQCQDLPGHELFQYVDDDGQRQTIDSADVNAYLREISGTSSPPRTFAPGAAPCWPRWRCGDWIREAPHAPASTSPRRWRWWPGSSGTRRPSAGSATSIPRSSRLSRRLRWVRR